KSRAAKQWLQKQGVAFGVREYLEQPLTGQELLELRGKLGAPLRDWVRDGAAVARCEGMPEGEQDGALAQFLAENPSAMQRPILIRGEQARVGRPLEALEELL
ncbi:MAG: arsenate reductase (glutaredoxin), partial [Planctomycetota bacterium]|nr:arsenate reductase (glutaredoxin) [Planctomycetota bacterium]